MRQHHRKSTKYIELNTRLCQACWKCIEICPFDVLGKVEVLWHRHARINNADACSGCKKCVGVCENGAIVYKSEKHIRSLEEEKAISY